MSAIIRRCRFSRKKGDLAASFRGRFLKTGTLNLGFALLFFLSGCAITPISFRRHEIYELQTDKGKLTVHVAGKHKVNVEHTKASNMRESVYGFYDSEKQEIWTTAYIDTIMHELKHFFEGEFHE